jgi:hemolysin III
MDALPRGTSHLPHLDGAPLRHSVEEFANALTHGLGALAALIGGAVLVAGAALRGDGWQLAGAIVFSTSLLMLYLASTLYHSARAPVLKARLKVFDHCAIYLLIAGTYTPFTLGALRGTLGWSLFATLWTLAFSGVVFKLFFTGRFKKLSTGIYIAMGWLGIVAIRPMLHALDDATLWWLLAGGLAYTLGTVFYLRSSRFSHAIWHLFCVAGSSCHYIAVMRQVV